MSRSNWRDLADRGAAHAEELPRIGLLRGPDQVAAGRSASAVAGTEVPALELLARDADDGRDGERARGDLRVVHSTRYSFPPKWVQRCSTVSNRHISVRYSFFDILF